MRNNLREQLIVHPGELGTDREEIIRSFFRLYLPKRFEISTGFVIDSKGNISQQLDIIIADSRVCSHFETIGGTRIFPCESVVAVGQVRSSITSESKLYEALDNLQSVKALDRSASGKAIDCTYNELIDHQKDYLHQIFTFLFVTGKALSPDTVRLKLLNYIQKHEPYLWPNVIFVLDRYLITFCCDDGICPNPMHARGIAVQQATETLDILFRLYVLLGRAIEVTRTSGLPYWEYLHEHTNWDADVWYSTREYPPPHLSDL